MSPQSQTFAESFRSAVARHFAFLVVDWRFENCGTLQDDTVDPRDRRTVVRHRAPHVFIDVVLTYIDLGLFVYIWPVPNAAPRGPCWNLRPTNVLNFDLFLQARLGDAISPLFAGVAKTKYLTTMYNEHPTQYTKLMASQLPEAVERIAARFTEFGSEAIEEIQREHERLGRIRETCH